MMSEESCSEMYSVAQIVGDRWVRAGANLVSAGEGRRMQDGPVPACQAGLTDCALADRQVP
jgi:hypothetical protein